MDINHWQTFKDYCLEYTTLDISSGGYWVRSNPTSIPISTPSTPSLIEIKVQKALGTLSYKTYLQLLGIIYVNDTWYFPLVPSKYYPVTNKYIQYIVSQISLVYTNINSKDFAKALAIRSYSCIAAELNIDELLMDKDHGAHYRIPPEYVID